MTIIGKQIRMERIMDRNSGRTLIVPLDHGVSVGPIDGITDIKRTVAQVAEGEPTPLWSIRGWWGRSSPGRFRHWSDRSFVRFHVALCLSPFQNPGLQR